MKGKTTISQEWFDIPHELDRIPAVAGDYILEFDLHREVTIFPWRGRRCHDDVRLGPGGIRYYGSAHGSGGLIARIRRHYRHLGSDNPPHWNIDALTAVASFSRVMISRRMTECDLFQRDLGSGLWKVVAKHIGSRNCKRRCGTHVLAEVTDYDHAPAPTPAEIAV